MPATPVHLEENRQRRVLVLGFCQDLCFFAALEGGVLEARKVNLQWPDDIASIAHRKAEDSVGSFGGIHLPWIHIGVDFVLMRTIAVRITLMDVKSGPVVALVDIGVGVEEQADISAVGDHMLAVHWESLAFHRACVAF
jgi:hypothetical protein